MSVMVLEKEMLVRIGKHLSLMRSDQEVVSLLDRFLELNQQNYAERYDEPYPGPCYQFTDITFRYEPLPSAVQVHSDIRRLIYNCVDYGDTINPELLEYLEKEAERVAASPEYALTKRYSDHVAI